MAFDIKQRGRLTYYYRKERPAFSYLVTEHIGGGVLKIYLSGLTGGESATRNLGLPKDDLAHMDPDGEIPRVFQTWEAWLREAGVCQKISELDFIEMHVFGCQPKEPNPVTNPVAYGEELKRIRNAYAHAYPAWFREHLPEHGLPVRFTVHVIDVPDPDASYEFYTTALLQKPAS